MWDVRTQAVARSLESSGTVTSVEVTEGGRYVVSADGGRVDVRDGATFELLKSFPVQGYQGALQGAAGRAGGGRGCAPGHGPGVRSPLAQPARPPASIALFLCNR